MTRVSITTTTGPIPNNASFILPLIFRGEKAEVIRLANEVFHQPPASESEHNQDLALGALCSEHT